MQNLLPKVSIITICYNAEKYLERTIRSIIAQTYSNVEYLIIDGKSNDRTTAIIQKYADHIHYFISEPDKGLYDAMNKGLKAATGDYVWFINAGDCIYDSTTLENAMRDAQNKDFIYGETIVIDEAGNQRPWHKKTPRPDKISPASFRNGMVICHHSMIVKRGIAPEYDLHWRLSGDIDWAIRVLQKAQSHHYVNIPFCLYLDGGLSDKNRRKSVKERFYVSLKHFGLLPTLAEHVKIFFQMMRRGRVS